MMQVALVKYQAAAEDAPIVMQLQASADTSIKSRKIEIVVAALCSLNSAYRRDILSTPSFVESVTLISRMSPGGKLSLARTLLEQINA